MSSSNESTAPTERILRTVRAALHSLLRGDGVDVSYAAPVGLKGNPPGAGDTGSPPTVVLVGVSGGVDSAVALWATANAGMDLRIVACHLDHGIRSPEEAEKDREVATALAAEFGVPLETDAVPRGLVAKRAALDGGTEAAAREFRYTFYERLAAKHEARALVLGHHRDDQVETVLLRLLSGSDPAALAGIPSARPLASSSNCTILRPLLELTKAEIREAAATLGLPVAEDATNVEMTALRNRVRGRLIPALPEIAADAPRRILATQRRSALLREMIEEQTRAFPWRRAPASGSEAVEPPVTGSITLSAPVRELAAVPAYLRLHLLLRAFGEVSPRAGARISERFLAPLLQGDLADMTEFAATGYGVAVTVAGGEISLKPEGPAEEGEGRLFVVPGFRNSEGLAPESVILEGVCGRRRYRLALRGEDLSEPVMVRSRRPGDVLVREGGSRRVKRVLIDMGVPRAEREAVPIVEDREGVVAVIGSAAGCEDALRRGVRHGQLSRDHVIFQVRQE
ncbi:MAG: tRNA lysidine(34) synthetase TilS [Spirochaetaceae bacterium]